MIIVMDFFKFFKDCVRAASQRNVAKAGLRVVETADQVQTDAVWDLLTEQIAHGWDESLPKPLPNPDGLYRPTLIGAWAEDRLVGGAFIMPDTQDAQNLRLMGADDAAQSFERSCCMIQGIAVSPEHRRKGIGLRLKLFCDMWTAQHDACIVLSIPTNDAARRMNEKAGYKVLPPEITLCIKIIDNGCGITCALPIDDTVPGSCWAFHIVAQPKWVPLAIGQGTMGRTGRHDDEGRPSEVRWMYYTDVSQIPGNGMPLR